VQLRDGSKQLIRQLDDITNADVSEARLDEFRCEDDFMEVAVELLVETACYVTVAACLYDGRAAWDRHRAAVAGNIVRLYKLLHGFLDQLCQRRGELAQVFTRLIFETLVNVRYLIKNFSDATVSNYISSSLVHERKLRDRILVNIDARSGIMLPIEDRMLRSIDYAARKANVSLDQINLKGDNRWGGSIYTRCADIGWADAYLYVFSGGSSSIHGNWQELAANHLEWDETRDGFTSKTEWALVRPQQPLALARLILQTLDEYAAFVGGDDAAEIFETHLSSLHARVHALTLKHEAYLSTKSWPEI
jgi:hypothetical protein